MHTVRSFLYSFLCLICTFLLTYGLSLWSSPELSSHRLCNPNTNKKLKKKLYQVYKLLIKTAISGLGFRDCSRWTFSYCIEKFFGKLFFCSWCNQPGCRLQSSFEIHFLSSFSLVCLLYFLQASIWFAQEREGESNNSNTAVFVRDCTNYTFCNEGKHLGHISLDSKARLHN